MYYGSNEIGGKFNDIAFATFTDLSVTYAKLYKENPKAFISGFRKFKSVRMACAWIVWAYKAQGVMREVKAYGKDFSQYADKYFDGETARLFNEICQILYAITSDQTPTDKSPPRHDK